MAHEEQHCDQRRRRHQYQQKQPQVQPSDRLAPVAALGIRRQLPLGYLTSNGYRKSRRPLAACGRRTGRWVDPNAGTTLSFNASRITCRILSTKTNSMSLNSSFGTSSKSLRFKAGIMILVTRARRAARTFSLMPPTARTLPRKVISPVMATSFRTGLSDKAEIRAVAKVIPADGPSLGIAPSGM